MEYIYVWNNGYDRLQNSKINLTKLLKICEYFENYDYSVLLIRDVIIHNIDKFNCASLLILSYEKLGISSSAENTQTANQAWFDLFYSSLDVMAKHILYFLEDVQQILKITSLNNKILEELIEKSFSHMILNNYLVPDESDDYERKKTSYLTDQNVNSLNYLHIEDFEKLINFLFRLRNVSNVYDLLTNEYLSLSSEDSINELSDMPNPTFQVSIPNDFNNYNYYNEFPIELGMQKNVVFVIYYKKSDDSLNVSLKLTQISKEDLSFKIFTFLSIVNINDDRSKNQVNVRSVSSNKSNFPIFKMNNFKQYLKDVNKNYYNGNYGSYSNGNASSSNFHDLYRSHNSQQFNNLKMRNDMQRDQSHEYSHKIFGNEDPSMVTQSDYYETMSRGRSDSFTLKINLRICFMHTAISSYLLRSFYKSYNCVSINKISVGLLKILVKSKSLKKENEDQIVVALLNWLNDEINLNEDITDVLEHIEWKKVSFEFILELIMKHYRVLENLEIEKMFQDLMVEKLSQLASSANGSGTLNNCSNYDMVKNLTASFFKVGKKLNYSNMFLENKKMSKVNILQLHNQLTLNKEKEKEREKEVLLSKSSVITNKYNNHSINQEHSPNMTINELKENTYYKNNLTETDTVKKIRNTKHITNILNKSAAINHFKKIEIHNRNSSQVSIEHNQVPSGNQVLSQSHMKNASIVNLNSSNANLNRSKSRIRINAYSSKENNLITSSPSLTNKTLQYKKIRNISLIQPNNLTNLSTINKELNTTKNKLNSITLTSFKPKITNSNTSIKNLRDNSLGHGQSSVIRNGNGERSNNSSVDKKKFIFKAKYTKKVELEKNEKHMINKFMDKMLNLNMKNNK